MENEFEIFLEHLLELFFKTFPDHECLIKNINEPQKKWEKIMKNKSAAYDYSLFLMGYIHGQILYIKEIKEERNLVHNN